MDLLMNGHCQSTDFSDSHLLEYLLFLPYPIGRARSARSAAKWSSTGARLEELAAAKTAPFQRP